MSLSSRKSSPALTSDLITGDLHLNDNPRDLYRHGFVATVLFDMLRQHKPDRLVILGDLTEEKDRHSAWLVNKIVDHFRKLLARVPEVVIVRGNHDYLDEGNPFFGFLGNFEGLDFISKPWIDDDDVLWLPHTVNYKRDWAKLERGLIAYTHNTFDDFKFQQHGIPLEAIPADRIISGDIHIPHEVGNLTYVGAPYRVNFGDDYEPRVLLRKGGKFTSIETGDLVPQKRLIELASPKHRPKDMANPRDIVKIRAALEYSDLANWNTIRNGIATWAQEKEFVVYSITPVVHYEPGARTPTTKRKSDRKFVEDYGRVRGIDEATLKTGLGMLDADKV